MPSQFFGLNIAYTGLLASNAALNTTSNNIANVQTKGYSRQEVNQAASSALRVFQTYGCAGAGVDTLSIERIRDGFYDTKYWNNNAKVGEYSMKEYYMQQIETYFDDNGKNAGFKTVFDQLMTTGLQALMDNPGDATTKTQFVGYAGALTEYFNGVAGNLENVQKDVNSEIKLKVDEINSIAGQIATLNKQINTIELTGVTANELRDKRELLVDQLSEIVDVKITEYPIVDLNNPERETGANRYIVRIAGGQMLVDGNEYNGLECRARETYEKVNLTDVDGLYDVYWENGQRFSLYNAAMGGALQGLIQMRDGNNGENFTGQITRTDTIRESGVTHDVVTVEVGKAYLQDLNKCNLSDSGGIITLGNQEFYYDSWKCEISYDDAGKEVYSYTFVLSDNTKNTARLTNDRVGKVASIGASISYQGVPYYMKQMNEWVRTFSQKFNDIMTSGVDSDNEQGAMMFTGNHATDGEQYDLPDENRYDLFRQGHKLLQEAYENAPEIMVLETAAKSIYDANIQTQAFQDAVSAAKQTKQAAKEEAKIKEKINVAMTASTIQSEITTRADALVAAGNAPSKAAAEKQIREEIENDFRNGTNGRTQITLTSAEEADIQAAAEKEATAEVEAKYKAEALAQAEKDIKDADKWDAAIADAKKEILAGTDEGKAALEQAKAEIAEKNEVPMSALDLAEKLVEARKKEIEDEGTLTDAEDILKEAFKTVKFTVNVASDSYYWVTAMNFSVNAIVENDPTRIANRYKESDGPEQNDLLEDIRDLATDKDKMTFRGSSASEFLQCILADVTLNASRANMFSQSFRDIANTIDNQRISISGVDEDEEAVNLVKYQNGYNLASKMIQTLTEIYDRLILETGV
ncbi:MAG: flagellar hook-associated protein FlgK [Lachnospiraceae bacterium]|nr:flagellar hook-associated protein FlgK [Lachnospiraceae bacterium]MCM1239621.1 flagellar hook-associated protein FlgK [Lachnospiraceae bacterium]MCM1302729.1 flagellar hook-associated protein FlgK [Butyrivibrio sp.]MCM1342449.1 flagellar hook-associated protein FlgK [Muribaculaceae bacterium]MCM1410245.1 flagellar hook-associated protein FlgK [Lachnospiraceae bacterium]